VLMNNHGATVVGRDLRELVSRSIFMCHNAEYQLRAQILGKVTTLTAGETRLAGTINAMAAVTNRTWEYWTLRLAKAGGMPPEATKTKAASKARPRAASVKATRSRTTPSRGAKSKKSQTRGRSR
jgi:hypothetical protein